MNSESGEIISTLMGDTSNGNAYYFIDVDFSGDGKVFAAETTDYTIALWDPATGKSLGVFKESEDLNVFSFSPDGTKLAAGSYDTEGNPTILLYNVSDLALIYAFTGNMLDVERIGFSPDGKIMISCSWDGTIILWDMSPF
jgi:WD40 repeat protein